MEKSALLRKAPVSPSEDHCRGQASRQLKSCRAQGARRTIQGGSGGFKNYLSISFRSSDARFVRNSTFPNCALLGDFSFQGLATFGLLTRGYGLPTYIRFGRRFFDGRFFHSHFSPSCTIRATQVSFCLLVLSCQDVSLSFRTPAVLVFSRVPFSTSTQLSS